MISCCNYFIITDMEIQVVKIGNSRGIRIPKSVIDQLYIQDKLELEVHENEIVLKPVKGRVREGWRESFADMHGKGEDEQLVPELEDEESFDWEWE